jgi:hypothetical protein
MVLMVEDVALAVPAAVERSQHVKSRLRVERELIVEFAQILKSSFIDDLRADDLRVADLQSVLESSRSCNPGRQRELADAGRYLRLSR